MILNGMNNETRIKVSGRQREWSFRNYICRQKKPSLMG